MVMYANGQREIMKQSVPAPIKVVPEKPNQNNSNSGILNSINTRPNLGINVSPVDTTLDYKTLKVKYMPGRMLFDFASTLSFEQEARLIPNILNFGVGSHITFIKDAPTGFSLYLAPYLPINRLLGNYENQDKGLFLFGKIGAITYGFETFGLIKGAGLDLSLIHI